MKQRVGFDRQLFWITLFIAVICFQQVRAQEESIVVESGKSVAEVIPQSKMFRYPAFINSMVHYKDNSTRSALLNYNIVLSEMMFIGNRKDTLVITNRNTINFMTIQKDTFYAYDQGYFELLEGNATMKLLVKQYLKLTDIRQEGAYGSSSSTGAIDNISSSSGNLNTNTYKLKVDQDMVYTFKNDYYFFKQNGELLLAKKSNLTRMLPDSKDAINKFLKEESIRFNQMEDLIRLTVFISSLNK